MADAPDTYAAYYASKLWALLPAIYRTLDPTGPFQAGASQVGPLQELVNRVGTTAAVLRRSIDRMWEDQSIESCDDWVIPYIAAQVGANLVSGSDARQQRLDVANTIYYRRRKGTLPLLEELAHDITGWEARAVEMFQRLGRARHGLDATPGAAQVGQVTRTPPGGSADLRNVYGAGRAHTPFDEFSHTVDVRVGSRPGPWPDLRYGVGNKGWHNLGNLAVFLYRLESVSVDGVTPVAFDGEPSRLTFDPTGREIPLFAAPLDAYDTAWLPRREYQLPGPIDRTLLKFALSHLYGADAAPNGTITRRAIALYQPAEDPASRAIVPLDSVSADPEDAADKYVIDPERGTLLVPPGSAPPSAVGYRYGFSSTIGAGGYGRLRAGRGPIPSATTSITGGGANLTAVPSGVVEIGDSLTYATTPSFTVGPGASTLVLRASDFARPVVRPAGHVHWTFTGTASGSGPDATASKLVLDGLLVSGCDVVLAGVFDEVTLRTATLDPGAWHASENEYALAADGRRLFPSSLVIVGSVGRLTIDRCIVGPVLTASGGSVEAVVLRDSVVHAVNPHHGALEIATGMAHVTRCSVIGRSHVHAVEASDSIFAGTLLVADDQRGCVRFSACTASSILPRQYACAQIEVGLPLFASLAFGHPEYAALLPAVDPGVGTGAENGSEMGAFSRENNPIKERSLLIKYQESMPIGLVPVLVYVT